MVAGAMIIPLRIAIASSFVLAGCGGSQVNPPDFVPPAPREYEDYGAGGDIEGTDEVVWPPGLPTVGEFCEDPTKLTGLMDGAIGIFSYAAQRDYSERTAGSFWLLHTTGADAGKAIAGAFDAQRWCRCNINDGGAKQCEPADIDASAFSVQPDGVTWMCVDAGYATGASLMCFVQLPGRTQWHLTLVGLIERGMSSRYYFQVDGGVKGIIDELRKKEGFAPPGALSYDMLGGAGVACPTGGNDPEVLAVEAAQLGLGARRAKRSTEARARFYEALAGSPVPVAAYYGLAAELARLGDTRGAVMNLLMVRAYAERDQAAAALLRQIPSEPDFKAMRELPVVREIVDMNSSRPAPCRLDPGPAVAP